MIYLDYAATTPVAETVKETVKEWLDKFGNPSSMYKIGLEAKDKIEEVREIIAKSIKAKPEEIYFTSGGTESNNTILYGFQNKTILASAIEHPAIISTLKHLNNIQNTIIPVNNEGMVDIERLEKELKKGCDLVTVMTANNEIGTVQKIADINELCHWYGALFHTDATQAYMHIPMDCKDFDMMSASAHKFYGLKGTGFIYINENVKLPSLIEGGGQERGFRSGTGNVIGIIAMGEAVKYCQQNIHKELVRLEGLRRILLKRLKALPGVSCNTPNYSLTNNVNLRIKGIPGEVLVEALNSDDIYISSGSACHSNSNEPSHVLKAIGLSDEAASECIRITMGKDTTADDIDEFIKLLTIKIYLLRG